VTEKDNKKREAFKDQEKKEKEGLSLYSVKHMMHMMYHFILI